jgi:hypothetical protein
MFRTYNALLRGTRIEWIDHPVIPAHPVPVHVTLLEEDAAEAAAARGHGMAAALQALAEAGGLSEIPDPLRWQREQRQDRALPGRED